MPRHSPAFADAYTPAMPRIEIENVGSFEVPLGKRLVNALTDECGQDQMHSCGGVPKCTSCRVEVHSGETSPMTEAERAILTAKGLIDRPGSRLSCQMTAVGDASLRVVNRYEGSGKKDSGPRPADEIGQPPIASRKIKSDWVQVDPACRRRTVALGESIHHLIVEFQARGVGAMHQHPHEQTTYVLSGRCRYTVNGSVREMGPGDIVVVPGNTPHGMVAIEATTLFDTFSPPRQDILEKDGVL